MSVPALFPTLSGLGDRDWEEAEAAGKDPPRSRFKTVLQELAKLYLKCSGGLNCLFRAVLFTRYRFREVIGRQAVRNRPLDPFASLAGLCLNAILIYAIVHWMFTRAMHLPLEFLCPFTH